MNTRNLLEKFGQSPQQKEFISQIEASKNSILNIQLLGLVGSSLSFVIAHAFQSVKRPFLLLFNDKEEAAHYLNDLEQLVGEKHVLFYPGSYKRPYQLEETDNANVLLRAEVLNRIQSIRENFIIATYPEALFEKVISQKEIRDNTLQLQVNEHLSLDFLNELLFEYHFKRVDFVTEPGEFSVRGGIVDVFSFSHDNPYRIEFFGDEIDSIREFDIVSQRSIQLLQEATIVPNVENKTWKSERDSFFKHLPAQSIVWVKNFERCTAKLDELYEKAELEHGNLNGKIARQSPDELFIKGSSIQADLKDFTRVELSSISHFQKEAEVNTIRFHTRPQPSFNKSFDRLTQDLLQHQKENYTNILFCATAQQARRFEDIFRDRKKEEGEEPLRYHSVVLPLYQGFIDEVGKQVCYTDHQIFERYHKFRLKNGYAKKQALTLKELTNLEVGDYVVHIDHGIGRFGGLQKIEVEGKMQEAIKLIYAQRDVLYLSIHSLHKITKYNGKDGTEPTLHKLGGTAWARKKNKAKSRVKHIAYDLIQLYAKRKLKKGFQCQPDSYLQNELEASFIYEDTPDQSAATEAVKKDMESPQPMDRLVCGDVGFGKTEVAIRAAFKAVDNGKQVAVLVPTTILAFQHYQTFTERLKDMPVNIDYLSRFRTQKEKNEILEKLKSGTLDIVIGTHQLVNKKVVFKDLGLLVVDEEQKFGVGVKDKLKTLKENVDTLTLTATPIPRTLQFSLMAARDLSTITTPPPNRFPIETHLVRFSEETIRDAVSYEIQRGGQVFFIHNRIQNIKEVAGMIQRLVPDARIGVGHGQMEGKKLEELMLSFMNGEFDVLVSTTIVESGLDVSNANTILINEAHRFGLSDLHQMRGRVGRSNKKAFCYFITPPDSVMTEDARKRLQAIEQFSDLGSGINIAMKDLEIRGAGDLLGGEQSGFINDIGFETYQKILNEAVEELKENEFKDLYEETESPDEKTYVKEVQIDTDFALMFPDDYVNNITERLRLYTQLNQIDSEEKLDHFEKELEDRFGKLPVEAVDLLDSIRIKWIAMEKGMERVIMKKNKLICYFIANQDSKFYQSQAFSTLLQYVQTHAHLCTLKEKETRNGLRLLLRFENIKSVADALQVLLPLSSKKTKITA